MDEIDVLPDMPRFIRLSYLRECLNSLMPGPKACRCGTSTLCESVTVGLTWVPMVTLSGRRRHKGISLGEKSLFRYTDLILRGTGIFLTERLTREGSQSVAVQL